MPLYNRERDFTEATISTLRENLKGETEPYTEFRQWMNEHADAFKDTSFSSDLLSVDRYMTDRREFNETALHELNRMERAVHEADEHFAGQCKETAEELRGFAKQIDDLSQTISSTNFIARLSGTISPEEAESIGKAGLWLILKLSGLKNAEIALLKEFGGKYTLSDFEKVNEAKKYAEEARNKINALFQNKSMVDGDQSNAFLHGLWCAIIAYTIGAQASKDFSDAHEVQDDKNSDNTDTGDGYKIKDHKVMDLHNNSVGIQLAEKCPKNPDDVQKRLMEKYGSQEKIDEEAKTYGVDANYSLFLALILVEAYKGAIHCEIVNGKLVAKDGQSIAGKLVFIVPK